MTRDELLAKLDQPDFKCTTREFVKMLQSTIEDWEELPRFSARDMDTHSENLQLVNKRNGERFTKALKSLPSEYVLKIDDSEEEKLRDSLEDYKKWLRKHGKVDPNLLPAR